MKNLPNPNYLKFQNFQRCFLLFTLCLLLFTLVIHAQNLPDEIRGYKVYNAKISVTNQSDKKDKNDRSDAFARLTEPKLADTSPTGLTFEISAEIDALNYQGKINFLTFKDFTVNGLSVNVEEYTSSFEFKRNQTIALPKPIKIFLGTGQFLKGALGEATDSKEDWVVTGKVFVFGKFKKSGFNFKRVVPVDVSVTIKNPVVKEKILPSIIPSF